MSRQLRIESMLALFIIAVLICPCCSRKTTTPADLVLLNGTICTLNDAAPMACFDENVRGSLEEGRIADIPVFDRNFLAVGEEGILKAAVVYTIIDGKVIFERRE